MATITSAESEARKKAGEARAAAVKAALAASAKPATTTPAKTTTTAPTFESIYSNALTAPLTSNIAVTPAAATPKVTPTLTPAAGGGASFESIYGNPLATPLGTTLVSTTPSAKTPVKTEPSPAATAVPVVTTPASTAQTVQTTQPVSTAATATPQQVYTAALTQGGTSDSALTDYLKKQVAANTEAQLANLKAAYTQNVNTLNADASGLPTEYDAARNAAAVQAALAKKAFDERAEASGLNTGTGGQAELARGAVLQGNLTSIDMAQSDALNKIALQKANLQAEYENAIAAAKAKGDETLAGYLYKEMVRQQTADSKAATGSSGSGGSSGSKSTGTTVETAKPATSSSTALNNAIAASQTYGGTVNAQIAAIEAMREAGEISASQASGLIYALKNPSK